MSASSLFQPTLPARGATQQHPLSGRPERFQPTLPARGATSCHRLLVAFCASFNPRSPHGERQDESGDAVKSTEVSTHAPRTGSDITSAMMSTRRSFQPTLPARGATRTPIWEDLSQGCFNPRSPHGERPNVHSPQRVGNAFQPTLPARGATTQKFKRRSREPVSTHAPRTGSDTFASSPPIGYRSFNPRSPHGERRFPSTSCTRHQNVSTHAPRTGSDGCIVSTYGLIRVSTHAPRTGSDSGESSISSQLS